MLKISPNFIIKLFAIITLSSRVSAQLAESKNVIAYTLPKTGTNLVLKLLRTLLNEKSNPNIADITKTLYWGHTWTIASEGVDTIEPSREKIEVLQKKKTKVILLLRDPRQHVIALLRALRKPINNITIAWGIRNFPLLLKQQTGAPAFLKYTDINACYSCYLKWATEYPDVYITSFEKLVGPKGGGSTTEQVQEIRNIMQFLGEEIIDSDALIVANSLFGGTHTFREGKIDSWKKHYSAENKALFKEIAGDLLIKLGYEKNNNW